jgi:hypothetical protein
VLYRLARCRPWVAVGEEEAAEAEEPQLLSGLELVLVPRGRVRWRLAPMPDLAPVPVRLRARLEAQTRRCSPAGASYCIRRSGKAPTS